MVLASVNTAPTLGVRIPSSIAIMSYSTYPIKLQLFQLILLVIISALKRMADLKNEKRKKEDKSPNAKEKKNSQVLILRLGR